MNDREAVRYDRFERIIGFRDARPAQFPAGSKAAEEFDLVQAGIADMDAAEGKQAGGKQKSKPAPPTKKCCSTPSGWICATSPALPAPPPTPPKP